MAKSLRVGQSYTTAASSNDSTQPLDLSKIAVSISPPTALSVEVQSDGSFKVTALTPNVTATVTWSEVDFNPASESVTIAPRPSIVMTDGPVS